MAAAFKGAISFGLVHIPISLYTATQDSDIHFNQLCRDDKSQIKYKKVCAHYGKEITANDIVKGFEYEKDKYIIMTEDDFEKAKSEKDRGIHILHFTDLESIRPIYCEKTYRAVPETGGGKAFELLRHAMKNEGKVAIAKTVIGTQEKTYVIMYQKVEIKSTKNNKGGSYYEWKKCSRAYTSECNGSKCTIWGTSRCVEGVPMPGKCNNAYTSKCNQGLCALFGTPKCIDGQVK